MHAYTVEVVWHDDMSDNDMSVMTCHAYLMQLLLSNQFLK